MSLRRKETKKSRTNGSNTDTATVLVVPTPPLVPPYLVHQPPHRVVADPRHRGSSSLDTMNKIRAQSKELPPTPSRPDRSPAPVQPRNILEGPIVDETLKRGTIVSASVTTSGKLLDFVVNLSGTTVDMLSGFKAFQGAIGTSWIFTATGLNLVKNHNDGAGFSPLSDTRILLRLGIVLIVKQVLKIEGLKHVKDIMAFFSFVRTASLFVSHSETSPVYDVMEKIANVPFMIYNAIALLLSNALPDQTRRLVAVAIDGALGVMDSVQAEINKKVRSLDIMVKSHLGDIARLPAAPLNHDDAFRVLKEFGLAVNDLACCRV